MTDVFSQAERSRIMARIRSRGNRTTELRFVRILRRFKIKGWRRGSKLPGRPDFVFPSQKIAVFVDGDFWHGNPKKYRLPRSNIEYWAAKLDRNRKRDELINMTLKGMGWRVTRIWESALRDEEALVAKLKLLL